MHVSLKIKLKQTCAKGYIKCFFPQRKLLCPPQNNLTDVFSTGLKHLSQLLTRRPQLIGFVSLVHTVKPHLSGWPLPHAAGGGLLWVSGPARGSPRDLGWGQPSGHRVRCAGRGAGSTVALEQAGQGAGGSCGLSGLAVGGGRWAASAALGHCCVTALSSRSPCFLPRPLFRCGPFQQPRGGGEAGLGEVERFIPGEQAVGERRVCQDRGGHAQSPWLSGGLGCTGTAAHEPCTPTLEAAPPLRMTEGLH